MIGSIYFASGTFNEYVHGTDISREWVTDLKLVKRGIAVKKHDERGAITKINDFKKQEKRYHFIGDIIGYAGSTAWAHQITLGSLFEAGGTFRATVGSDGTYTGAVSKYKFAYKVPIDKFNATIEFICGSSK